jgi:hypothetical protein
VQIVEDWKIRVSAVRFCPWPPFSPQVVEGEPPPLGSSVQSFLQELQDEGDRHTAFANGGSDALDGAKPDITAGEDAGNAGLSAAAGL